MKRKLLSVLLTLCLAFSLLPTAALAEGEGTLAPAATALPEAVEGVITLESKTYKLSENLTVTATIVVPSGVTATLDLGGKTLKRDSDTVLDIYGELTIKNGRIEKGAGGNAVAIWLNNAAKLTVESDAVVSVSENAEADCYCIAMWKDCTAANLTVKGTLKGGSGLTVNGLIVNTGNTVTIDGATIEAVNFGIYQAGVSETVIKDSNIKGSTAIEVRAGSMTIESGTFTATATEYKCDPNDNGATTEGAALAIAQHTTKKDISVTINGGTFTGIKALNESNPQNNDPTPQVTLNVKNGTFNGDVTITDGGQTSITGGTFTSDVSAYVPNGYIYNSETKTVEPLGETNAVAKIGDTYYKSLSAAVAEIHTKTGEERAQHYDIELLKDATGGGFGIGYAEIKNNATSGNNPVNFTIKMNGHTYTMTTPTVGSKGTETNGIQLLMNSNVTFEGGTIEVDPNLRVAYLFQNYANLTLKDMNIDISAQPYCQAIVHPMHGIVNILGNTNLTNVGTYSWTYADNSVETGDKYAIMVMDWNNNSYGAGTQVTVKTLGIITGIIHTGYYQGNNITSTSGKSWLKIESGYFNGTFS